MSRKSPRENSPSNRGTSGTYKVPSAVVGVGSLGGPIHSHLTGYTAIRVFEPEAVSALPNLSWKYWEQARNNLQPTFSLDLFSAQLVGSSILWAGEELTSVDAGRRTQTSTMSGAISTVFPLSQDPVHFTKSDVSSTSATVLYLTEARQKQKESRTRLHERISDSLRSNPIEDGVKHPIEAVLREEIATEKWPNLVSWIVAKIRGDDDDPQQIATIVQCLARVLPESAAGDPASILMACLASSHVAIREAGMRLVEAIPTSASIMALIRHSEPVEWLCSYQQQVIADFRAEQSAWPTTAAR